MATLCRSVQEWVEDRIERPVEDFERREEERCRHEDCDWWTLCLNKLFCWLVVIVIKVVRIVVDIVGKWVPRLVCEIVSFTLDVGAFAVNLIMSIPLFGGIVRTILNWATEIGWRIVGLFDFGLSLIGVRWTKKMYVGLLIPRAGGAAITTETVMMRQINEAKRLYGELCNVEVVYTGACDSPIDAPTDALTVPCDAGGWFGDWGLAGSFREFAASMCNFTDGWRRVVGFGAEILVIPVLSVTPDTPASSTVGCSFASTHNFVVVEPTAGRAVAAHEIGHACWLSHSDDVTNLMTPGPIASNPTLSSWQVSVVRWSKHCVYF